MRIKTAIYYCYHYDYFNKNGVTRGRFGSATWITLIGGCFSKIERPTKITYSLRTCLAYLLGRN